MNLDLRVRLPNTTFEEPPIMNQVPFNYDSGSGGFLDRDAQSGEGLCAEENIVFPLDGPGLPKGTYSYLVTDTANNGFTVAVYLNGVLKESHEGSRGWQTYVL
jgi:hypothetical protein